MAVYILFVLFSVGALAEVQITVTPIVNLGTDDVSVACQFSTNDSAITDVNSIQMYSNTSAPLGSEESKVVSIVYDRSSNAGLIAWQHSGLESRANVSGNVDSPQSSLLHLHIPASQVLCEDGAAYRCEFSVTRSGSPLTDQKDAVVSVREGPTEISYSTSSTKPESFSNATLSIYPANTTVTMMCNATVGFQPEPMQLCYYDTSVNGTGYVPFTLSNVTDSGVMATDGCNNRRVLSFEYHLETNDSATFLCIVGGNETCGEGTLQQSYTIISDTGYLLTTSEPITLFTTTEPAGGTENNTMLTTTEPGAENNATTTIGSGFENITFTTEVELENITLFTTTAPGIENHTLLTTAEPGLENHTMISSTEPHVQNNTLLTTADHEMANNTLLSTADHEMANNTLLTTTDHDMGNNTLLTTADHEMANNTLLTTTDHGMGNNTLVTTVEAGIENSTYLPSVEANGTSSTPRDPVSESFTSGTVSMGTEYSSTFVTFTDPSFSTETTLDSTHTISTSQASASAAASTASTVEGGAGDPTTESVLNSTTVSPSVATTSSTVNISASAPSDTIPTSTASPVSTSFPPFNVSDSPSSTLSTAGASDSPGTTLPPSTSAPVGSTPGATLTPPTSSARKQIHTTGLYFLAYVLTNVLMLKK